MVPTNFYFDAASCLLLAVSMGAGVNRPRRLPLPAIPTSMLTKNPSNGLTLITTHVQIISSIFDTPRGQRSIIFWGDIIQCFFISRISTILSPATTHLASTTAQNHMAINGTFIDVSHRTKIVV